MIQARPYPSGSDQVRYSGGKPGSGRGPGHSLLRFQSGVDHIAGLSASLVELTKYDTLICNLLK